jgi:hypothetical protein
MDGQQGISDAAESKAWAAEMMAVISCAIEAQQVGYGYREHAHVERCIEKTHTKVFQ